MRPRHTDVGQRYAETQWSWYTDTAHEFSRETDYARIALPDYQTVLLPQVAGEWVLVLRIICPAGVGADGPGRWTAPNNVQMPTDVLGGLAELLDSQSGDVQFVCLEHMQQGPDGVEGEDRLLSRKRIIYAHSEVLRARSSYFKQLLDGGFKETEGGAKRVVVVDDAGYDVVYWLLR